MRLCFVSTSRGSPFMTELLQAVCAATTAAGYSAELVLDRFPPARDDRVYVVIPHEFHAWGDADGFPDAAQRARTIAMCTENPGTEWFEATFRLVPELAAAVSINRSSAIELRRRGVRCEHLQLGYSDLWDTWHRDDGATRPIDVLYLGAADPRRDPLLAGIGGSLWARACEFLVPPLEPRTVPRPDFLQGADKYDRLRGSKVLLNLHRKTSAALEWMRFLEAICNGCVVVSEPCLDNEPLVPGEHFLAVEADDIGGAIECLLGDPDRLQALRERAYDQVRDELPMRPAVERLLALAAELPRTALASKQSRWDGAGRGPLPPAPPSCHAAASLGSPAALAAAALAAPPPASVGPWRRLAGRFSLGRERVKVLARTAGNGSERPRVSVLALFSQRDESEAVRALGSVAASTYEDFELVLMGTATAGRAGAAIEQFLDAHPALAATLLAHGSERGLGPSRNELLERARGQHVFVLNTHGGIYPSSLGRLVRALDADPGATFAYPMVAALADGRPVELLGSLPWEPARLARGSWIDAMALLRRERLLELGGYAVDPRLGGWEDWELWCRCAELHGHGVHVPQVLGWHRPAAPEAEPPIALMRARFPRLFACGDDA